MKISYEFSAEDWAAMQKDYVTNLRAFKKTKILSAFIGLVLSMILMGLLYVKGDFNYFFLSIAVIFSIGWVIIYPGRFEKQVVENAKKKYEKKKNETQIETHKLEMDDKEIVSYRSGFEVKARWDMLTEFRESNEHMFLYTSSTSAIVIPKNKVISDSSPGKRNNADTEEIFNFIREKAKK
jgi:hypothetical protein